MRGVLPQPSQQAKSNLAHDLRHSLFALRTGIDLLPHVQQDPGEFRTVQELLAKEIGEATLLAKQLLDRLDATH